MELRANRSLGGALEQLNGIRWGMSREPDEGGRIPKICDLTNSM